jgi:uncharacterized protein (TIGR03083 family)
VDEVEASRQRLDAAVAKRTAEIVAALGALDDGALRSPSELPEWSRLTIACHLRYGAAALRRMTTGTLSGQPVAYYPEGRDGQRPGTLVPGAGEGPADVVTSLTHHGNELHGLWSSLDAEQWRSQVVEPAGNPDLGSMALDQLPVFRLTEVEVHGSDLGLGLADWSELFVRSALPLRLDRLNVRRANHRPFDTSLEGAWLLVASDGPSYRIGVRGAEVESAPAPSSTPARAVLEATSRDLLALLLGRPLLRPVRITGDAAFGAAFTAAFPGP